MSFRHIVCYPGTELHLQDQLATDVSLKGLRNQKMTYEVMNRDPQSLTDAQKLAEAHEHNFKATLGREGELKTGRTRRISWAYEEGDAPEEFLRTSCRLQDPKYVTEEQFKALIDKVEQLHIKLEQLQTCGDSARGSIVQGTDRGRKLGYQLPPHSMRTPRGSAHVHLAPITTRRFQQQPRHQLLERRTRPLLYSLAAHPREVLAYKSK